MKKIEWHTYLKFILFLGIFIFVWLNPKNIFDIITSDMFVSLFGQYVFGFLGKIISYIFHDKILLLIMGFLGLFLFYLKEYRKAIFLLSTAFFGSVITLLIKNLVHRTRPLPDIFDGYSFPSGHSTVIVLFFASLVYVINKKELVSKIAKFAIVLVPLSRVIIGAHYITDVIAGVLLGYIVVDLMKVFNEKFYSIISNITGISENEKK